MFSGSPVIEAAREALDVGGGGVRRVDRGGHLGVERRLAIGTLRSRASSRKLLARSASFAASAASISLTAIGPVELPRQGAVGQHAGSSCLVSSVSASSASGTATSAAIANSPATMNATATRNGFML